MVTVSKAIALASVAESANCTQTGCLSVIREPWACRWTHMVGMRHLSSLASLMATCG